MTTPVRRRHAARLNSGRWRRKQAPLRLGCDAPDRGPGQRGGSVGLDDLPDVVLAARRLLDSNDGGAALRLLHSCLDGLDVAWLPDDPVLVDAYTLYASLAIDDQQMARARYAYDAAGRLHPPHHPRCLAAVAAMAGALQANGDHDSAIEHRRDLVVAYEHLGLRLEALSHRAGLAESLHSAGHCDEAGQVIAGAWDSWRQWPTHNGGAAAGVAILRTYLGILFGCRRQDDVAVVLEQACRSAAVVDSDFGTIYRMPLDAQQIADHRHICAHDNGSV